MSISTRIISAGTFSKTAFRFAGKNVPLKRSPRKPDAWRAPRYLRSPAPRRSPAASVPRPPFRACSTHCDVGFSFSSLRFYRDNNTYDELCSPGSKSPARRCADHICRDQISHRSPSHRSWGAGISGGRDSAHGPFPWVLCRL